MAVSYFGVDFKGGYELNNFRSHDLGNGNILLVNDYGSWVVLDKGEYELVKSNKDIPSSMFELLKQTGIILTDDNIKNVVEDYRKKLSFLFQGPSLHIIVLTSRCNQNCVYCYACPDKVSKRKKDMNEETAKKVIDFIFQTPSPIVKIEFQGGEPLLNFNTLKFIVEYSKERNKEYNKRLEFAVSTNLTLMSEEILDYLIKNEVSITTSLDGPEIVNNKNRHYPDGTSSYDKVTEWIKIIKNRYKIDALLVTTKYSLLHWKEIIDEYLRLGLGIIWVQPLRKIGNALKNWDSIGYDAKEFLDFWKKSVEYILELNKEGKEIKEISTTIILKKILKKSALNFCDLQSPCGAIVSQLSYGPNGGIYVCDEARQNPLFRLGNVKKNGYEEVMISEKSQNFIKSSINDSLLCDSCVWKPYCGVCPVCNYSEQGNIIPKLPLSYKCRINKEMFDYVFKKFLFDEEAKHVFLEWIKPPGIV